MINFRKFFSSLFESREYHLPNTARTLMFDFYVLSYIRSIKLSDQKNFLSKNTEELASLIADAEKKLLPKIKAEVLDAVFYSICSEMRLIIDLPPEYLNAEKLLTPSQLQLFNEINEHFNKEMPREAPDAIDKDISNISRDGMVAVVNNIITLSHKTRYDFVDLSRRLFSHPIWSFGGTQTGKAWIAICDSYLNLARASTPEQQYIAIDHLYDIQHTTGSVFDKVPRYYINGSIEWLKKTLDFKANVANIQQLFPFCSSDLRRIALAVMKRDSSYGA